MLENLESKYKKKNSPSKNPFKRLLDHHNNKLINNTATDRALGKI